MIGEKPHAEHEAHVRRSGGVAGAIVDAGECADEALAEALETPQRELAGGVGLFAAGEDRTRQVAEIPRGVAEHDRVQVDHGDDGWLVRMKKQIVHFAVAVDNLLRAARPESAAQLLDHAQLVRRLVALGRRIQRDQVAVQVVKAVDHRLQLPREVGENG